MEIHKEHLGAFIFGSFFGASLMAGYMGLSTFFKSEPTIKENDALTVQLYNNGGTDRTINQSKFDRVPVDKNGDSYITPSGEKIHSMKCHHNINMSTAKKVNLNDAVKEGYTPCNRY